MQEDSYKNREIDEMFEDIQDTLGRIENQTTKTNGRVSKLEQWQSYVIGFCASIGIIAVPILLKLFVK